MLQRLLKQKGLIVSSFSDFNISPEVISTLTKMGFTTPTEIQEKTLPVLLNDKTQDLVALASTGTGKTAAFGIPLVEKIDAKSMYPQALVLSPTRELASQVAEQLKKIGAAKNINVAVIYGGSSYRTQVMQLKKGAQIVVATPGRLVDLLEQDLLSLTKVKVMILDEADEMLSMGFQESLNFILSATHPEDIDDNVVRASCQTWLFSATMNSSVRQITKRYLEKPFFIEVSTGKGLSPTIRHSYFTIRSEMKTEGLLRLLRSFPQFYGFIFCQTKVEVAELEQALLKNNLPVESLHGDKVQRDREFILKRFRSGETKIVVATDVAARGLDIQNLTHVINFSLPWNVETYIHRVGRTGRNGSEGHAITLVGAHEIRSLVRLQKQTEIELHKGVFPKAIEHAVSEIKKILDQMGQEFNGSSLRLANQAVQEIFRERPELQNSELQEFLPKLFLLVKSELFNQSEKNLDFLDGKVPREFDESAPRSFSGGGRGGRSGYRSEGGERRFSSSSGGAGRSSSRDSFSSRSRRPSSGGSKDFERGSDSSSGEEAPRRRFASTEGRGFSGGGKKFSDSDRKQESGGFRRRSEKSSEGASSSTSGGKRFASRAAAPAAETRVIRHKDDDERRPSRKR